MGFINTLSRSLSVQVQDRPNQPLHGPFLLRSWSETHAAMGKSSSNQQRITGAAHVFSKFRETKALLLLFREKYEKEWLAAVPSVASTQSLREDGLHLYPSLHNLFNVPLIQVGKVKCIQLLIGQMTKCLPNFVQSQFQQHLKEHNQPIDLLDRAKVAIGSAIDIFRAAGSDIKREADTVTDTHRPQINMKYPEYVIDVVVIIIDYLDECLNMSLTD